MPRQVDLLAAGRKDLVRAVKEAGGFTSVALVSEMFSFISRVASEPKTLAKSYSCSLSLYHAGTWPASPAPPNGLLGEREHFK